MQPHKLSSTLSRTALSLGIRGLKSLPQHVRSPPPHIREEGTTNISSCVQKVPLQPRPSHAPPAHVPAAQGESVVSIARAANGT